MDSKPVLFCILLLLAISITGCTISPAPVSNITGKPVDTGGIQKPTANPPTFIPYIPNASENSTANSTTIPVLLTSTDWKIAGDCGLTVDNLSETAALFMNDCQVRRLQNDGWETVGIGYDMNFIGSRCRKTTHPDATDSCDWCLDAGPTLTLRYKGVLTTELMAHVKEKTVTGFRADLPEEAVSVSTGDSEIIRYRNGTVLYTFREC
jgi:hypothetical protein